MNVEKIAQDHGLSVEEVRSRWLGLRVAMWKSDLKKFCKEALNIRAKNGDLVKLEFNEAQLMLDAAAEKQLDEEGWVRLIGMKGRRQGFSTYVAARGYWRATLWDYQNIYILSHEMQSSDTLFGMVALMQQKHPFPPAVGTDNAKTLELSKRGSSYTVATAGQKAGGRGGAISYFHGSEAAWWTNAPDHFASSVQGVDEVRGVWGVLWQEPNAPLPFERGKGTIEGWVKAPSEIWLESTSAGPTGEFYRRYMEAMKGEGRYRNVFVPWVAQKEYTSAGDFTPDKEAPDEDLLSEEEYQRVYGLTDDQMLWRREKLHELGSYGKFQQEYPIDITEAFSVASLDGVFILPTLVLKSRKRKMEDPDAPLIMGVDCAGAGGDRFAVTARRGDKVLWTKVRKKLEHDDAVAWLASLIDEHKPNRMNIDNGSMGSNIRTSLRNQKSEYAAIVRGIDFGGTSSAKKINPKKCGPVNVRAEIYSRVKEWLTEGGCIPDDDDLASDLSAPKIKYRQNNDWLLEAKSDMKARGVRSPDLGDSLALTFASKEYFPEWSKPKIEKNFANGRGVQQALPEYDDLDYSSSEQGWMM